MTDVPHRRLLSGQSDRDGPRPGSVPPVMQSTNKSEPIQMIRPSSAATIRRQSGHPTAPLDLMSNLERALPSIVKSRNGSVLSRGFILKTDHYPSGRALDLSLNVHGAPNFRSPKTGSLNVFGCAQPRTQGLRAILSVLQCRPDTPNPSHVVWFSTREEPIVYISGRPFVLRDASEPKRVLALSDRAENLEAIEQRLKNDILQEAARFGGLVLTHNEMVSDLGDGAILPTWTAVDQNNVRTSRELWDGMKSSGWSVDYHRIPISPDRPIEDNYLDAYLSVIKDTDPVKTSLVFSCGMGAVRTTFAMITACIVRRKQLMDRGFADPYAAKGPFSGLPTPGSTSPKTEMDSRVMLSIEQAHAQSELSKSLLRLTYLLQTTIRDGNSHSAIDLLMKQPSLLENLRKAHMGNYGLILSLLGLLDNGQRTKSLVDRVIDDADEVTHLREDILLHRIKYSLTSMEEEKGETHLKKAGRALEKYFFTIAFASYVEEATDFKETFSDWLKARTEIWNQVTFLRKSYGYRLTLFAPINDLSALSKSGTHTRALVPGTKNDVAISGGEVSGDEYSTHVVKNRKGIILRESTLLKTDQWHKEDHHVKNGVRGAINFRQITKTNIYALGQPTVDAIEAVVSRIQSDHEGTTRVLWITLREEPIVYVNGEPYCLRREGSAVRNMRDYGGISASRLEVLEERLRDDVVAEATAFGGQVLLHTETPNGTVVPIWEETDRDNVDVLKTIMNDRRQIGNVELIYDRVPITAERPPDFSDLQELIEVVLRSSRDTPIVVNCQLGRGRSTLVSIILVLIRRWLDHKQAPTALRTEANAMLEPTEAQIPRPRKSYQVVNNLLRVIRKGVKVKNVVDDAIDQCDVVCNLREEIEENRIKAEQATDEKTKKLYTSKGLQSLRRYFELIVFQAYLQSTEPDTLDNLQTVENFVKNTPVIKTFERELEGVDALKPLEQADYTDGVAHPDEVRQVVVNRSGRILSASTILKSDFFSNLQKMTLPERIDGSPNFRRVPLTLALGKQGEPGAGAEDGPQKWVCGSGMPTAEGLKRALKRVDAGPGGSNKVYWTSLREEPVIYVAGRPHVLRLVDKPLENVEATGVTTAMVETMEESFKKDVLREVRAGNGRVLLHDEVEERPGVFSIIPIWEEVEESDILTPRDVFDLAAQEGYNIDYGRIAITDEQAPLPEALSLLLERVCSGMSDAGDFVFNCQMGRGRTTTGMITACLISTTLKMNIEEAELMSEEDYSEAFDSIDGPSEEDAYLQGEYKTILQLVGVLSHGKVAKLLADKAIDQMQDVQNLRKAIYDYKLKVDALPRGTPKERKLRESTINYLFRYATLIVFSNYLIEVQKADDVGKGVTFPQWLTQHREITKLLERRSLD
ncbi:hypothetical protein CYLTODRAFT_494858 [Cylindrobasidium torrendii FP15055 ss-10]|uniref:Tyrosine specific protein phosphatases domain-containing protein n=1 Tax=Cylindrobasidium torrendii FP15055 ss-10 TaxID=1314674 RepID=A0A0D7AW96_9AGAR|nr:hypothetical protein CYLTODRAFT_494858 [Cylindrobasidium torrendii FP15055 ss-10]